MNRFGKLILGLLILGVIALGTMIRFSSAPPSLAPDPIAPAPPPPPSAVVAPSGLAIPVAGVTPEKLADSFGDPRGGGTRGHGALDILAPEGTLVLAAAGGTVEKLFESGDGGHTIYIRSPDRAFVYYYAHLQAYRPGLAEGEYVARGAEIGTVGSTGDADAAAPHLHFEVKRMGPADAWHQGEAINPYPLLAGSAPGR